MGIIESDWWKLPWLDPQEEKLKKKDSQMKEFEKRKQHFMVCKLLEEPLWAQRCAWEMAHHILDLHVPESREMPQSEREEKFIDMVLFSGLKRAESK